MACKYEGTGIWAGRCKGTKEVDPCPGYDKCEQYKPDYMTNADRIRAMSDEELEDLFREVYNAGCDDATAWEWGTRQNTFIWDEEWLKQPATEDEKGEIK